MDAAVFRPDELDALSTFFLQHGYAVLRGLYDEMAMGALQAECEALQAAVARGDLPPEHGTAIFIDDTITNPIVHYVSNLTPIAPLVSAAATHPALQAAMARTLGAGRILEDERFGVVYQDARPGKESAYTRIGWHSDWQSGPHLDCWPSVAFTIHIDATSPSNGFLRVVPGSHLWATPAPAADIYGKPGPVGPEVTGGRTTSPAPAPMPLGFEKVPGEVAVYCDRGDVILHDAYLWHSAARATEDESLRRHVRGGYYAKAPDRSLTPDDFVKNARR